MNPLLQRAKDEVAKTFAGVDYYSSLSHDNQAFYLDQVAELYSKYRVEEETEKMRKALEAIKNPIKHLQDLAESEGNKINGSTAIALANSPDFYRNIAEKALNP